MNKRFSISCINVRNTFHKVFYPLKDSFKNSSVYLEFLKYQSVLDKFLTLTDAMSRYLRDQNKHCL